MRINCLGASGEVGRSGFLLEEKNTRVLLDYGVKLTTNEIEFPLPVKGYIDAVLLSHGHLDHCGNLPVLYQKSECPCFLVPPTIPITEILLKDTLKIAESNKTTAPFSENHIKNYVRNCRPTMYKKKKSISDVDFEFMDAGHILGASFILIYGQKYNVAYTGDIKLEDTEMHYGAKWPKQNFDILITETTYAIDHPPRKELEKEFIDVCQETIDKNIPIICPAFALGRTQELITMFDRHDFGVPIYLDGMGKEVSEVYMDHVNYIKEGDLFVDALNKVNWVTNQNQRYEALSKPSIIVTSAGMLNGGPIVDYLFKIHSKKAAIYLTGYQVKGTAGRILLETGIFHSKGQNLNFKHLDIRKFDFSAHAGISELKTIVKRSNPKLILGIHGDQENSLEFKRQVEEEFGAQVIVPHLGQKIEVGEFI